MGAGVVKPQPGGEPGIRIHIHTGGQRCQTRTTNMSTDSKKCEECGTQFNAFKKKKLCKSCARHFCSSCTVHVNGSRESPREQQCKKCDILMGGNFTRPQLTEWKVKDLKALLHNQNVNTSKCKEKSDLIDLVFTYFSSNPNFNRRGTEHQLLVEQLAERMRQQDQEDQQTSASTRTSSQPRDQHSPTSQPHTSARDQTSTGAQPSQNNVNTAFSPQSDTSGHGTRSQNTAGHPSTNQNQGQPVSDVEGIERLLRQSRELNEAEEILRQALDEEEKRETQPEKPHMKLDDIKTEEEIESLSIKELKRVLLNNFVDYKGCCEKFELQDRVRRLWKDNEANKRKIEEHRRMSEDPTSQPDPTAAGEDDVCKICMDAAIDCVLLECGHMVTCTNCGKRLSECPICRQYVVRAVHTFKA